MKYFFMSAALVGSLALPLGSFAATSSSDSHMDGFYTKLQYNGEFFNRIGNLSSDTKEFTESFALNQSLTKETFDYAKVRDGKYEVGYKPYLGGSVAVGYSMGDSVRVEIEGLYSRIKVKDKSSQFFGPVKNIPAVVDAKATNGREAVADKPKMIQYGAASSENEGFTNLAGMINAYYDVAIEGAPVTPYIGAGIGLAKISFMGSSKHTFAYQVKGGLKYDLNQNASFFAGYRYFGVLSDQFSIPASLVTKEAKDAKKVTVKATTIDIKNSFAVHGIEAGLIFKF